jgi:hypothetical protein
MLRQITSQKYVSLVYLNVNPNNIMLRQITSQKYVSLVSSQCRST